MRRGQLKAKRALCGALAATVAAALVAPAAAATKEVAVVDNRFESNKVTIAVGDTVKWSRASSSSGAHNVTGEKRIFRSGEVTSGSLNYSRTFSAGTFKYYCEIHRYDGMKGIVKVPVLFRAVPSGSAFTVQWGSSATNTGAKFDVEYRVGSGAWKTWKKNATATKAVFGGSGQPPVMAGKAYGFRARSQKGDAESRWSPVKTFKA